MANCYNCAYRQSIPGDAHSHCTRIFNEDTPHPELNTYGIQMGWCMFPANYDPVWVGDCKGFAPQGEGDPELARNENSFEALFDLLTNIIEFY